MSRCKVSRPHTTDGEVSLCDHCGDELLQEEKAHREKDKCYHETCYSVHIPRSIEAVERFKEVVPSNKKIVVVAINVRFLYKIKKGTTFKIPKKEKRENKIQELLKYASAFRNSGSGHILIQFVGLDKGDEFTGAFDEFADQKLNDLIQDDRQFADVYKKENLGSKLTGFEAFLVLYVVSSKCLTTSDYETKVALDDCFINPSFHNIRSFLQERKLFVPTYHSFDEERITCFEDLKTLQENRCIQLKANFPQTNTPDNIVDRLFHSLKLAECISAFTKLEEGGSYVFGIAEEEISQTTYKSKTHKLQPISTTEYAELRKRICQKTLETVLVCDYDGNEMPVTVVKVNFIHSEQNKVDFVLHVSVRSVEGLVFYEKSGPLAYRYNEKTNSVERFTVKEWFSIIGRGKQQTGTYCS